MDVARGLRAALIAFAALVALTHGVRAFELCGRTFDSIEEAYRAIAESPSASIVLDNRDVTAFADRERHTVWTFVKPEHPAAPAVVCRRPQQAGVQIEVLIQMMCGGPQAACDALLATFQASPTQ